MDFKGGDGTKKSPTVGDFFIFSSQKLNDAFTILYL